MPGKMICLKSSGFFCRPGWKCFASFFPGKVQNPDSATCLFQTLRPSFVNGRIRRFNLPCSVGDPAPFCQRCGRGRGLGHAGIPSLAQSGSEMAAWRKSRVPERNGPVYKSGDSQKGIIRRLYYLFIIFCHRTHSCLVYFTR